MRLFARTIVKDSEGGPDPFVEWSLKKSVCSCSLKILDLGAVPYVFLIDLLRRPCKKNAKSGTPKKGPKKGPQNSVTRDVVHRFPICVSTRNTFFYDPFWGPKNEPQNKPQKYKTRFFLYFQCPSKLIRISFEALLIKKH